MLVARLTNRCPLAARTISTSRTFATVSPVSSAARVHKIVVVGGGSAGLTISHQLLRSGKFAQDDIAVVDPAALHHYQPGWTLVGGGLKTKEELQRPLNSLIDQKIKFYNTNVDTFSPQDNLLTLNNGDIINYEQLVVAPGINIDYGSIKGLPEALDDPDSAVSTIYGYHTCEKSVQVYQETSARQRHLHPPFWDCQMWRCAAKDNVARTGSLEASRPVQSKGSFQFSNQD